MTWFRVTAAASSAAMLGTLGLAGTSMAATGAPAAAAHGADGSKVTLASTASSSCHLGNGVKHVVELTFDNVHYFRDNPNVPSDLQMMPNLLNFFENNGTFLSNNHTPLIAHTADALYFRLQAGRQTEVTCAFDCAGFRAGFALQAVGVHDEVLPPAVHP